MMSQTLGFIFDQPLKQRLIDRKRKEKLNIQEREYLEKESSFSDKIKKIFIVFDELSFGLK